MLAQVGFENRHKEIVDSSFTKSRRAGKELAGKNAGDGMMHTYRGWRD